MNFDVLPVLKPFSEGLTALAERDPHYKFLVTQGGLVRAPRNPHRLIRLLSHQLQQKGENKAKFKLGIVMSRNTGRLYSWGDGRVYHVTGMSYGHIVIEDVAGILEIAFGDRFDTHGQVVRWQRNFLSPA